MITSTIFLDLVKSTRCSFHLETAMHGLKRIIGQEGLVNRLTAIIEFSRTRGTPVEHFAIVGPPGSGKRTIACALAEELGVNFRAVSSKALEKRGDLTAILTALETHEVLCFEDIGQMRQLVQEVLPPALNEFRIDLQIGHGASARIHPYKLNRFTCICTLGKESDIPTGIQNSLGVTFHIQPYSRQELAEIGSAYGRQNQISISPEAAHLIARISRGAPEQAILLIERLKRFGQRDISAESVAELLTVYGQAGQSVNMSTQASAISLDQLSGTEFEEFISSVLQKMGFRSEITKATGDGGIDIVATLDQPIIGGRYLIQCKRFASDNPVGAATVREFYGALTADRKAVKGILITTSSFTQQAEDFAESLPLELIDGDKLRTLLET